jgi:hypothetical protein
MRSNLSRLEPPNETEREQPGDGHRLGHRLGRLSDAIGSRIAAARSACSWAVLPAAIGLVSRVFSSALIAIASSLNTTHRANPFIAWDGGWYLSIAARGYHPFPIQPGPVGGHYDFAFFPGWPILIRVSTLGFLPAGVTSVLLADLLFVGAAVLIWRLIADRYGHFAATGAVALLAFSPPAYVFSMAYSEPLFLVVAALYFLSRAGGLRRPLLAASAMLVRIDGLAVVASAAARAVRSGGQERRSALLSAAAGGAAFAAWWVFIALLVHDPWGFMRASPHWGRRTGLLEYLAVLRHLAPQDVAWLGFAGLVLAGSLLAVGRDLELGTYSLTVLALTLLPGGLVGSLPRYAVVAFPAFAGLSERLGRRGTALLLVAFAAAQWYFVQWAFVGPLRAAP